MRSLGLLALFAASAASAATYQARVYTPTQIVNRYPMALDGADFEDRCVWQFEEFHDAFFARVYNRAELYRARRQYELCVRSTWMDR